VFKKKESEVVIVNGMPCKFFITEELVNDQGEVSQIKKPHPIYNEMIEMKAILDTFDCSKQLAPIRAEFE